MPSPKSGNHGQAIDPMAPKLPFDADEAKPGTVAEAKASQRQSQQGKYGQIKAKPFKPADTATNGTGGSGCAEDIPRSWIEIELVDEDDQPVAGEKYRIALPDGSEDEGTLDQNGWARIDGIEPGQCRITFPNLDQDAWEFIETAGPRS